MTKTYIDAKLQIVRFDNDIITDSVVNIGDPFQDGNHPGEAPSRRRSIWD